MARKPKPPMPMLTHIVGDPPEGLRDQLAVRALEILIGADPRAFLQQCTMPDPAPDVSMRNVARLSYALADAMLDARNG